MHLIPVDRYYSPTPPRSNSRDIAGSAVYRSEKYWLDMEAPIALNNQVDKPKNVIYDRALKQRVVDSITTCHLASLGGSHGFSIRVIGSFDDIRRKFVSLQQPENRGYKLSLKSGTEVVVSGTLLGDLEVRAGEEFYFDPRFLSESGQWTVNAPTGTPPNVAQIEVEPNRSFTLQRGHLTGETPWNDVHRKIEFSVRSIFRVKQ